jgi:lectin-like protein/thrombospondin type 3 repeat protein
MESGRKGLNKKLGVERFRPAPMRLRFAWMLLCALALMSVPAAAMAGIEAGPIVNPANGHTYYKLTPNSWTGAEAEAVALGGHLVTINDDAENTWVWDTFALGPFWIGLSDVAQDNLFVWASGEPATYSNWWLPNEPGGGTNENYVEMNNLLWNDNDNGNSFFAVVEIPVTVTFFSENFDTTPVDSFPSPPAVGQLMVLNAYEGYPPPAPVGSSYGRVVAGTPGTSNRLLEVYWGGTGLTPIVDVLPFLSPGPGWPTSGIVEYSWSVAAIFAPSETWLRAGILKNNDNNYLSSVLFIDAPTAGGIDNIVFVDGDGSKDTGIQFAPGSFSRFIVRINITTKKYDAFIDGNMVVNSGNVRPGDLTSLNQLRMFPKDIGNSYFYVDNILVTQSPYDSGPDTDGDGIPDATDNCPVDLNPGQEDTDGDGVGNVCDNCSFDSNPTQVDICTPKYNLQASVDPNSVQTPQTVVVTACIDFSQSAPGTEIIPPDCYNTVFNVQLNGETLSPACLVPPPYNFPFDLVPAVDPSTGSAIHCTTCNIAQKFLLEPNPVGDPRKGLAEGTYAIEATYSNQLTHPGFENVFVGSISAAPTQITITKKFPVKVDLKPGEYPNTINLGSHGVIPVAIYGKAFTGGVFDPHQLDLASLMFNEDRISVKLKGKGAFNAIYQDLNGDGIPDLIVNIMTDSIDIDPHTTTVKLTGQIVTGPFQGFAIEGSDSVKLVPVQ